MEEGAGDPVLTEVDVVVDTPQGEVETRTVVDEKGNKKDAVPPP
jgi:hypothetical protein